MIETEVKKEKLAAIVADGTMLDDKIGYLAMSESYRAYLRAVPESIPVTAGSGHGAPDHRSAWQSGRPRDGSL